MGCNVQRYRENLEKDLVRVTGREEKYKEQPIGEENKQILLKFDNRHISESAREATRMGYLVTLRKLALYLKKPFIQATKDDIISFLTEQDSRKLKESSIHVEKLRIKEFYWWLDGEKKLYEDKKIYPESVMWIKGSGRRYKLPDDIPTEEEIMKIANCTKNPRDKALIMVLYESGCRISELLRMKIKDLEFDEYGIKFKIKGKVKTEESERVIRIVYSVPDLNIWLNHHPTKNDKRSYLWVNTSKWQPENIGKPLEYNGVYDMLKRAVVRANIQKNISPHKFRHTRATVLTLKLPESHVRRIMGWTKNSNMVEVYLHHNNQDVDDCILENVYNKKLKNSKNKESLLKPKICPKCNKENPVTNKYCYNCYNPIDLGTIKEIEDVRKIIADFMSKMLANPEIASKLPEIAESLRKQELT